LEEKEQVSGHDDGGMVDLRVVLGINVSSDDREVRSGGKALVVDKGECACRFMEPERV